MERQLGQPIGGRDSLAAGQSARQEGILAENGGCFSPPPFYNFFFFKERRLTHAPAFSPRARCEGRDWPRRGPMAGREGRGEEEWVEPPAK